MNKSVTAHLGGMVFHLDESAYSQLQTYLNAIRQSLGPTDGVEEIMQDVESRIAEMLNARISGNRQVVLPFDIEAIVAEMGRPEDFGSGTTHADEPVQSAGTVERKFFRDPDDKLLGGVCSGISAYFNIDAIWIRLFFVFLFLGLGTGVLFYIILWIVIPKAKSSADKLRMRGEPVTISNIEKNIKDELKEVRQRAEKVARDGVSGKGGGLYRFFHFLGSLVRGSIKLVGMLFAAFFLFIALMIVFALFAAFVAVVANVPGVQYPLIAQSVFIDEGHFKWSLVGLLLALGIPFLAIAWSAARFLFHIRLPRIIGFIALGLWLIGVVLSLFLAVETVNEFKVEEKVKSELVFDTLSGQPLVLKSRAEGVLNSTEADGDDYWMYDDVQQRIQCGQVKLDVERSPDTKFHMLNYAYAQGPNKKAALANASKINYACMREKDSVIVLDPYFGLDAAERFRNQHVQLVLQVPEGRNIYLDPSLHHMLFDVENEQNIYDEDMTGRTWQMTPSGLSCLDCTGQESILGDRR